MLPFTGSTKRIKSEFLCSAHSQNIETVEGGGAHLDKNSRNNYFHLARHSLFSKGNPLDAISHWLIENRYFKNRNPKLQASHHYS
jgi:hypothetical protein